MRIEWDNPCKMLSTVALIILKVQEVVAVVFITNRLEALVLLWWNYFRFLKWVCMFRMVWIKRGNHRKHSRLKEHDKRSKDLEVFSMRTFSAEVRNVAGSRNRKMRLLPPHCGVTSFCPSTLLFPGNVRRVLFHLGWALLISLEENNFPVHINGVIRNEVFYLCKREPKFHTHY